MVEGEERGQLKQVVPLELEGLDQASSSESWGGNAGRDRAIVNATYKDGRFNFADSPLHQFNEPQVSIRLRAIPFELKAALRAKGIPLPPALIEHIAIEPGIGQTEDFFRERAIQHNAFRIAAYLQKGGSSAYLPKTPFMPDIDLLKEQLSQK